MSDESRLEGEVQQPESSPAEVKLGKKAKADKKKSIASPQPEEETVVASVPVEASEPIETPVAAANTSAAVAEAPVAVQAQAPRDQHNELFDQGVQSLLRGEYDAADNFFGQALMDYRKQGNQVGQISVLEQLGHLCFLRGAEAQAQEYYQQAGMMRAS